MSALETRMHVAGRQDFYWSSLPLPGATAEAMEAWITAGMAKGEAGPLARMFHTNDRGQAGLMAEGDEFERLWGGQGGEEEWTERVVVVRSPMHAHQQAAGLEKRLRHAEAQLAALTPPRGRGKRQITDEATLVEAIDRVLTEHRVVGLLSLAWEKQVEQTTHYVGRGRGAGHREKRVLQKTRYPMTHIARQANTVTALSPRCG